MNYLFKMQYYACFYANVAAKNRCGLSKDRIFPYKEHSLKLILIIFSFSDKFPAILNHWNEYRSHLADVIRSAESYLSSRKYNGQQFDVEGYFASVI